VADLVLGDQTAVLGGKFLMEFHGICVRIIFS
jgi:hypothetical protein